jgi:phospholipase C
MMHLLDSALALALVGFAAAFPTSLDPEMIAALKVLGKTPSDFRLPGSLPDPNKPAGTDLLPGIEHIVMIMFENHSFDNIWGTLDRPDVDGFPIDKLTGKPAAANQFANGTILHAYPMPMTCQRTPGADGPTQNWGSTHLQMNNGANDGFVLANGADPDGDKTIAMGYWTPEQLPFTHDIGKIFPICDRWFGSVPGQTWPNRMYLIGGTSAGITSTGQSFTGTLVPNTTSFFDTLNQFNISWTDYVPGFGQ